MIKGIIMIKMIQKQLNCVRNNNMELKKEINLKENVEFNLILDQLIIGLKGLTKWLIMNKVSPLLPITTKWNNYYLLSNVINNWLLVEKEINQNGQQNQFNLCGYWPSWDNPMSCLQSTHGLFSLTINLHKVSTMKMLIQVI